MKVVRYTPEQAGEWDALVRTSRNGTFLLQRPYMDYHKARFADASLLFRTDDGRLSGVVPMNVRREESLAVTHGGLTYGGLILSPETTLTDVREMFRHLGRHLQDEGINELVYKAIPAIYHRYPAADDLYWLFRAGAEIESRGAATVIDLDDELRRRLWQRKTKKKACEGLRLHEDRADHLPAFWHIVDDVLSSRHGVHPVHSAEEIALLRSRFPAEIKLFTVTDESGDVVTGSLLFVTPKVVHVQYMEVGERGRQLRALDWLMQRLTARYAAAPQRYFDFGISTEDGGRTLNEGLAYQKEGMGGRTVCYDIYRVKTSKLAQL